jgi:hypothetical protein
VRAAIEERAEPFRNDDGYDVPGMALAVHAVPR